MIKSVTYVLGHPVPCCLKISFDIGISRHTYLLKYIRADFVFLQATRSCQAMQTLGMVVFSKIFLIETRLIVHEMGWKIITYRY
jgi:hypothetical protein